MVAMVVSAITNKCGIEDGTASFFTIRLQIIMIIMGVPGSFGDWLPSYVYKSLVATLIKLRTQPPDVDKP